MRLCRAGSPSLMVCRASRGDECSALFADFDHPCSISYMFIQAESAFPGSNPFLVNIDVKTSTFIPAGILWALGCYSSCSCPQRGWDPALCLCAVKIHKNLCIGRWPDKCDSASCKIKKKFKTQKNLKIL